MEANRSRDTRPEVLLRSALHRAGLRFRKNLRVKARSVSVRVDVVFPRRRVAVFIDGCFWHGCPEHLTWPKANADWWRAKIERNVTRDQRVDAALADAGWTVIRVWEHEDPVEAARRIEATLRASCDQGR